ncbi:MAG: radical SAM protein, partial [Chitinivibrionales bacterium]|nr:radical SAM protein [Chitinivibrionales bacterium]
MTTKPVKWNNRVMDFRTKLQEYKNIDIDRYAGSVTSRTVESILEKEKLTVHDFVALLSDTALNYLEPMAARAASLTRKHFGNVIFLFTPLYISNYCDNSCRYCSFSCSHDIDRRHLSGEEITREARAISATGMRHILLLTGESPRKATLEYLAEAVARCRDCFSSIGIEVYPLSVDGYARCIAEGVDSLTIYQEVYDERLYHEYHKGGPKNDYRYRLEAPERACRQNMHKLTIGPLLGLNDFRKEAFAAAVHVQYLQH